jgi:hypothetical protein
MEIMFHALGNGNHVPIEDFNDICMKIIKACGGLPLSLKVLGSFLCNIKELEMWEGALSTLKSGQSFTGGNDNEKLWIKLRISYDHLDEQHKNMFLDIACFFGGLKINTICRVWSRDYLHPKFRLQNLQHRSLIQWIEGGILYIHEQLRATKCAGKRIQLFSLRQLSVLYLAFFGGQMPMTINASTRRCISSFPC